MINFHYGYVSEYWSHGTCPQDTKTMLIFRHFRYQIDSYFLISHLSKGTSNCTQNGTKGRAPFYGLVSSALVHGVVCFRLSTSSRNHVIDWSKCFNSKIRCSFYWVFKSQRKDHTSRKFMKSSEKPEICVSCVLFWLPGALEKCDLYIKKEATVKAMKQNHYDISYPLLQKNT